MTQHRSTTTAHIKWIAVLSMFIDHIGASVLEHSFWLMEPGPQAFWRQVDVGLRAIGRLAFPLYIFLLIEGFFHTRNRMLYLARLTVFCAISEIPFDLAFFVRRADLEAGNIWVSAHQNVFFTLALGFAAMMLIETLRPKRIFGWVITPSANTIAATPTETDSHSPADAATDGTADSEAPAAPVRAESPFAAILRAAACAAVGAAAYIAAQLLSTDYGGFGVLAILAGYLFYPRTILQVTAHSSADCPGAETPEPGIPTAEPPETVRPGAEPPEPNRPTAEPPQTGSPIPEPAETLTPYFPRTLSYQASFVTSVIILGLHNAIEFYAIFGALLIAGYHGEKGDLKMPRWFFYVFYPAHLALLALFRFTVLRDLQI